MSEHGDAEPVVELVGMLKSYPGVQAVQDVSLVLRPGEVVGLVGKNGAGKSTLIKMMAGLVAPDAGEIRCEGVTVDIATSQNATKAGLAFVHQELSLVPALSVMENVFLGTGYPRRYFGLIDWRFLRQETRRVLVRLKAQIDPRSPAGDLSIAQQRLVMIARALAQKARVLVLDEPTASLTDQETRHLFDVIERLRDEGVAILYVSHRLEEILELTDRTVVMRDGRVVDERATSEHTRASLVESITGESQRDEAATVHMPSRRSTSDSVIMRVEGLSRGELLRDVTFEVRAGEILGIAGLVGAGRTELVETIFGTARATTGDVTIHGHKVAIRSPRDAMKAGIVLLPEDRKRQGNIIEMDIAANISMPNLKALRRWRRLPLRTASRERAAARTQMSLLSVKAGGPSALVSSLSGGNQQKVMLGKWLLHGAEVFMFDEPTHGVDVNGRRDVYNVIADLAEKGKGVIFISSDFAELVGVVDRAIVLVDGRVRGEFAGTELSEKAILECCYEYAQG